VLELFLDKLSQQLFEFLNSRNTLRETN